MSKPGKFLIKYFKDREIEIWTSNEAELIKYNDSDLYTWTIFTGTLVGYDEDSGILVLETPDKYKFFLNEWQVHCFWQPGADVRTFTKSTINGSKPKKRDIV